MRRFKYNIAYDTYFFDALKHEVFQLLPDDYRTKANPVMIFKAIILLGFFVAILLMVCFATLKPYIQIMLMMVLGVLTLPLILNIGHEAVHRNFSTNDKVNKWAKGVFFLLGTSAYFWELRHNSSHHAFTNVKDVDLDIEQAKIIRLSKQQEFRWYHKFQHFYMPFAFCLYTLLWFFSRDFKDLGKKRFGLKTVKKHPKQEVLKMAGAKIWHIMAFLVLPYLTAQNLGLALSGFFVFHISASIVTTFALISTHVGEVQEIVNPSKDGCLPYSWAAHQLKTTADFSPNSISALHFFAGFNHHVAHHLFPGVPHVYYPKITPLIKKQAAIYGLKYNCYPNLVSCAKSHFKRLRHFSNEI